LELSGTPFGQWMLTVWEQANALQPSYISSNAGIFLLKNKDIFELSTSSTFSCLLYL